MELDKSWVDGSVLEFLMSIEGSKLEAPPGSKSACAGTSSARCNFPR
jgi:hypothetical protein